MQRKLLEASEEVFGERGYERASLQQIADQAGFTKGAVYSSFGSKPELYVAYCEERIAAWVDELEPRLDGELADAESLDVVAERLSRLLAEGVEKSRAHQLTLAEFRLLAARADEIRDSCASLLQRRLAVIEDALARHPLTADASPARLRSIAFGALTLVNAMAVELLAAPSVVTEELVQDVLARCVKGLLA